MTIVFHNEDGTVMSLSYEDGELTITLTDDNGDIETTIDDTSRLIDAINFLKMKE